MGEISIRQPQLQLRLPLPVIFVRFNYPERSMYYIDPKTARIVQGYNSRSRWNRWLYPRPALDRFPLALQIPLFLGYPPCVSAHGRHRVVRHVASAVLDAALPQSSLNLQRANFTGNPVDQHKATGPEAKY